MSYILAIFISVILFVKMDMFTLNTLLLILLCLSLSEFFKNILSIFIKFLCENDIKHLNETKLQLENAHKSLSDWRESLVKASKETTILQLKSLCVLLSYAVQQNDKNSFNEIIKRLKDLKVPDDYLLGRKRMDEFIKLVESNEYIVEFDKDTRRAYFKNKKDDDLK